MAKYDVTYSCGHTGVVSLIGKNEERERKLQWYHDCGLCPDCYAAKLAKENEIAEAKAEEQGLPKLTGSEKQVSWANSIRQNIIEKSESVSLNEKGKDFMKYILETETSASRWIDLRGYSIKELFGEYLNSYQAAQR